MALSFPASPTVGQIHSEAGRSWQWTAGGTWDTVHVSTDPVASLDGVTDPAAARTNLGLGTAATTAATDYATAAQGTDARTPTAHVHGAADVSSGTLDIARIPTGTSGTTVPLGNDARFTDARTPTSHNHAASEVTSGTLDIARVPTGTTGTTVPFGNDSRFTDARTPTAHKTSHENGGTDEIALDASQITTGIVAAARLGTGTANSTTALFGDGTYKVPSGGGGATWSPDPDPPGSPSAYDDEFDGTSSVTWSDTPTAATTKDIDSFVSGCLHLKGVGTNNNLIGVVQATPGSFPYTITFKLASRGAPVNYHRNGGIILSNGLTSGSSVWYVGQVWDGLQKWWAGNQSYAGAFYTSPGSHAGRGDAKYGRVTVASASSATAYYSDDGYVWVTLVTFNPGFTPTHMGLACSQDTTNSIDTEATFGFFRVT